MSRPCVDGQRTCPSAVSVKSAKPHDVQWARRILREQLDPKHPALPGLRAIVADRGYTGLCGRLRVDPT